VALSLRLKVAIDQDRRKDNADLSWRLKGCSRGQSHTAPLSRAAAAISKCIGIPPHLSLLGRSMPASVFVHDHRAPGHIENATKNQHPTKEAKAMGHRYGTQVRTN
jgi:hypothetical protein